MQGQEVGEFATENVCLGRGDRLDLEDLGLDAQKVLFLVADDPQGWMPREIGEWLWSAAAGLLHWNFLVLPGSVEIGHVSALSRDILLLFLGLFLQFVTVVELDERLINLNQIPVGLLLSSQLYLVGWQFVLLDLFFLDHFWLVCER